MPYPNINNKPFDRTVTLRDAYRVMYRMVEAHFQRGELSTRDLLFYLELGDDGTTGDPATLGDYLDAAAEVLGQDAERETA